MRRKDDGEVMKESGTLTKSLLSRCIPDLKLHFLAIYVQHADFLEGEMKTGGGQLHERRADKQAQKNCYQHTKSTPIVDV